MFKPTGAEFIKAAKKNPSTIAENVAAAYAAGFPKAALKVFIQGARNLTLPQLFTCYRAAFQHGGEAAAKTLLEHDFHTYYVAGNVRHIALMEMAAQEFPDLAHAVFQNPRNHSCIIDFMAGIVTANMPDDAKRKFIELYRSKMKPEVYLGHIAEKAPLQLQRTLDLLPADGITAEHLAAAAVRLLSTSTASREGIDAAFDLLLSRGMNVHHDSGAVLQAALSKGYTGVADKLVAEGFSLSDYGMQVYESLCNTGAPREGIDCIKRYLGIAGAVPQETQGYTRIDDSSVAAVQKLPSGAMLTTIFNFKTGQQLVVAQTDVSIAPPAIVPFSQLENRSVLAEAARAFVDAGGDKNMVENIFPVTVINARGLKDV